MIQERKDLLLRYKILQKRQKKNGDFVTLCQSRVIESRISDANLDLTKYSEASHESQSFHEIIFRYLTDDIEIKLCRQCQENRVKRITFNGEWAKFCSNECTAQFKVDNNMCWVTKRGWKHSEETKNLMSKNHADFSGDKNPFKIKMEADSDFREKYSENIKKRWASYDDEKRKEISENYSLAQVKLKRDNKNLHKRHKSGHFKSDKMTKNMFYRSSWELKVCEYLENNDDVCSYNIEPYYIQYMHPDYSTRWLRIDFEVTFSSGRVVIIEVKPKAFLNDDVIKAKIAGYEKYAKDKDKEFVLITEEELNDLESIL